MRNALYFGTIVVILVALAIFFLPGAHEGVQHISVDTTMQIRSSVFHDGDTLSTQYTCDGAKERPPLVFESLPARTRALAVTMTDPDAPTGTFVHWVMWNIPVDTPSIRADRLPEGAVEGRNSAGDTGWFAPCPPAGSGSHHYVFTIYALDSVLDLSPGATYEEFTQAATGRVLAQGEITGVYER